MSFSKSILIILLLSMSISPFLPMGAAGADSPPLLMGYGGVLAVGSLHITPGSPASKVFQGEDASNTEVTFAELKARGYNAARVSIVDPAVSSEAATYNSGAWHRTLQLAQYYGIWVVGDDHEYDCPTTTFWQPIFQDTPQSTYPNVLWETKNEPHCSTLASDDQSIINMARNMGDTRWFILGCNNDCSPSGAGTDLDAFPIVTDSVNHVFYDFHEYYFYPPHASEWTKTAAEAFADTKFAGVLDVQNHFGRPFLGTEFGADTGCGDPVYGCPPDQVIPGSAGYAPETVAYLSRLITDLQGAHVGYTVWNAGDWDDGPVGVTGALDTFGPQLPAPSASTPPPTSQPTNPPFVLPPILSQSGIAILALFGVVAISLVLSVAVLKSRHRRQIASSPRPDSNV